MVYGEVQGAPVQLRVQTIVWGVLHYRFIVLLAWAVGV